MNKQLIVVLIIFMALIVCLSGCVDEKDKFIGTWQTDEEAGPYQVEMTWTFYTNSTLKILSAPTGNYNEETRVYWNIYYVTNDELCYYPSDTDNVDDASLCFFYEFSNGDTHLQLSQDPDLPMIIKTMQFNKVQ